MLLLKRVVGEEIVIEVGGERIVIRLTMASRQEARLAFDAGPEVRIDRREIYERKRAEAERARGSVSQ